MWRNFPLRHAAWRGVVVALAVAVLTTSPHAASTERFTLAGSEVAIYNVAGEVRLEPVSGNEVIVTVHRGGRDAGRLRIETGPVRDRATLRVIYPGDRIVYPVLGRSSRTQTRIHEDGTFGDGPWKLFGGGREIRVSGSGSGLEAHADLVIGVPKGRETAVYLVAGSVGIEKVDAPLAIDTGMGTVTARAIRGGLRVDTGSGDVGVEDSRGDLDVDTGSGDVKVSGHSGPALRVDTGSGRVTVSGVKVDRLIVDTGSGRVTVGDATADEIVADTGSGSVVLDVASPARAIAVDTGSGSVTLLVPRDYSADYSIETGSGGIDIEVPHRSSRTSRDEARGRIGDGRGSLRIDTGSGSVQIRPRVTSPVGSGAHGGTGGLGGLLGFTLE